MPVALSFSSLAAIARLSKAPLRPGAAAVAMTVWYILFNNLGTDGKKFGFRTPKSSTIRRGEPE